MTKLLVEKEKLLKQKVFICTGIVENSCIDSLFLRNRHYILQASNELPVPFLSNRFFFHSLWYCVVNVNNVGDHAPQACFIDLRQFGNIAAVCKYLKATFIGDQQRIASFLAGDSANPLRVEAFAETIVSTIVQDIDCIA